MKMIRVILIVNLIMRKIVFIWINPYKKNRSHPFQTNCLKMKMEYLIIFLCIKLVRRGFVLDHKRVIRAESILLH